MDQEKKSEVVVSVRPVYLRMDSADSQFPKRFRDDSDDETGSQISSSISLEELEPGRSTRKWYSRRGSTSIVQRWAEQRSSCLGNSHPTKRSRGQQWCRLVAVVFVVLGIFGVIAGVYGNRLQGFCPL